MVLFWGGASLYAHAADPTSPSESIAPSQSPLPTSEKSKEAIVDKNIVDKNANDKNNSNATAGPDSASDAGKEQPQRVGYSIHITLPLDGLMANHVQRFVARAVEKARAAHARPVIILEFDVPPGQDQFGAGSDFGAAYSLANFLSSDQMNDVVTVAYLPKSIQGHAVLVALACDQIMMGPDAAMGPAGVDEKTITPPVLSAYREIAGRRRTVPMAIAVGLLDPAVEVLAVKTEAGMEYILASELEELKKRRTAEKPTVLKPAGEQGQCTAAEGRRIGYVSYLASNRSDVVKALELPPVAMEDDPSLAGEWRAMRVDLTGPIRAKNVDQIQKIIEDQIRLRDVNFICLWIDSPGGSASDAMRLANFLAFQLDPSKVRTVAYIPTESRSVAAIVAMACDQVVVGPGAVLGGPGAVELAPDEIAAIVRTVRVELAPRKGRSWSLIAAMLDPKLEVFRFSKPGSVDYFCNEELQEQRDAAKWLKGEMVSSPGLSLKLSGVQAEKFHLANTVVNDFGQFKRFYRLENDPTLVEPGWADAIIQGLASWEVAILLLVIGGTALYVEIHSPGVGVGAFVAAVCFLLFFWSRYLGGTAGWLEVSLFLAGVTCVLLEIFVIPGFGIFGLGGGILILASLVLASQTFVWPHNEYQVGQLERSLLMLVGSGAGLLTMAFFMRQWLPQAPLLNRMLLAPPVGEEAATIRRREALVDFHGLLGKQGITTTRLNPAGKAQFDDLVTDVMADGELIDRGVRVEVTDVRGSRVLVKEVAQDS
jgi:membrane-bound ClpP family serine protease